MDCENRFVAVALHRCLYWCVAALIALMLVTGLEIHGTCRVFGFDRAIAIHNAAFIYLSVYFIFMMIFYYHKTKQLKKYVGQSDESAVPPAAQNETENLSPLTRQILMLVGSALFFAQLISGALYLGYNDLFLSGVIIPLNIVAYTHTLGALVITAYLIAHINLTVVLPKMVQSKI